MKLRAVLSFFLILALVLPTARAAEPPAADELRGHVRQADEAGRVLQQVLGPMPAVATAPFFGLAVLSGVALLSETDAARSSDNSLVRAVCDSALVRSARKYASLPLFLVLSALALLTYLASSGKLQGVVGKLLRTTEAGMSTPVYGLLALGAFTGTSLVSEPAVAQMGFGLPSAVLLAFGVALGLGAMMVVRLACDVLIWLIPVPLIDLVFETAKKVVSVVLFLLCLFYPRVAAVLAVVVLVVSLMVYGWAVRVLGFAFRVVLRPWLARWMAGLRTLGLLDGSLAQRYGSGETVELAVPAAALFVRGVRKRQAGCLMRTPNGLFFTRSTALGQVRRCPIGAGDGSLRLHRGLLWIELQASLPGIPKPQRLALPKTLVADYDRLCQRLGAEDGGTVGGARLLQKLGDRLAGWRGAESPGRLPA